MNAKTVDYGIDTGKERYSALANQTPFVIVMKKDGMENVKLAQHLLDKGADVNARDIYGMTLLHHLVGFRKSSSALKLVESLVNKGAIVDAKDNKGKLL